MSVALKVRELERRLARAGYMTVASREAKRYSFSLIAKRGEEGLVIRVLRNIDSCRRPVAVELKKLAFSVGAAPFIVGSFAKSEPLLDGVLYSRFGVFALSLLTLQEMLGGRGPVIYAKRGGLFVKVNGTKLRRLREERGLSLGQLAKEVGVSRRAIYGYERGEMEAALEVAMRLEEVLGESVVKPMDISSCRRSVEEELLSSKEEPRDPLAKEIERIAERRGFVVTSLRRAPFELAAVNVEDESRAFIKTVGRGSGAKELREDLRVAARIAEITDASVIVVGRKELRVELSRGIEEEFDNVHFVRREELKEYLG